MGDIGVFDAEQELSAVIPGVEPVKQSGARTTDMKVASGCRSKTNSNGRLGGRLAANPPNSHPFCDPFPGGVLPKGRGAVR